MPFARHNDPVLLPAFLADAAMTKQTDATSCLFARLELLVLSQASNL